MFHKSKGSLHGPSVCLDLLAPPQSYSLSISLVQQPHKADPSQTCIFKLLTAMATWSLLCCFCIYTGFSFLSTPALVFPGSLKVINQKYKICPSFYFYFSFIPYLHPERFWLLNAFSYLTSFINLTITTLICHFEAGLCN